MAPALITDFSLSTLPSWATETLEIAGEIKRTDGPNRHCALEDSATIVQWLPTSPVFPFRNFSVLTEVRRSLCRKVLKDMRADGFLR